MTFPWLINGGDPNYLVTGMIFQVMSVRAILGLLTQLMVRGPVVWVPGFPYEKHGYNRGIPIESQTISWLTVPNIAETHQFSKVCGPGEKVLLENHALVFSVFFALMNSSPKIKTANTHSGLVQFDRELPTFWGFQLQECHLDTSWVDGGWDTNHLDWSAEGFGWAVPTSTFWMSTFWSQYVEIVCVCDFFCLGHV